MAKGDDAVLRKRGRAHRKKARSMRSQESVSARVAAIIAAKRRRKSGKRRICEGMCFTLPTPEDPFNDLNDPKATKEMQRNTDKKKRQREAAGASDSPVFSKCARECDNDSAKVEQQTSSKPASAGNRGGQRLRGNCDGGGYGDSDDCLSKYLILCLKAIQDAWSQEPEVEDGCQQQPLLACKWGIDFWKNCSSGLDIVDSTVAYAGREQVAWLVSTASDIIARKEKEGLVVSSPFLVFLVPSREKATEIRSVCKPLKALGVHMVSLHPGASLDHQVCGLKSCEPEFVVSTPERLLDLVNLKALDISGVSLLIICKPGGLSGWLDTFPSLNLGCSLKGFRVSSSCSWVH